MNAPAVALRSNPIAHPNSYYVNLPADLGTLPSDWWDRPAPQPPGLPGTITTPWVRVTSLPQGTWGASDWTWGIGVVFDPQRPEHHGLRVGVRRLWSVGAQRVAEIHVFEQSWSAWQSTAGATHVWLPATKSSGKPSNATSDWVKITHDPGTGPTINGQATEQGRGIVYRQTGGGSKQRIGTVVVYDVKSAQGGLLAEVSYYETSTPISPQRMPTCTPSQALYRNSQHLSGWPEGHGDYACGYPAPWTGGGIDPLCGPNDQRFTLEQPKYEPWHPVNLPPGTPTPPPSLPPPSFPPSGGTPLPEGFSGWCGELVHDPEGVWAPATFFSTPPPGEMLWIKIHQPPGYGSGYEHQHFGHGTLHVYKRHDRMWFEKDVLIVEVKNTEGGTQARYVPNTKTMFPSKPKPPGAPQGSGHTPSGIGPAPYSQPQSNPPAVPDLRLGSSPPPPAQIPVGSCDGPYEGSHGSLWICCQHTQGHFACYEYTHKNWSAVQLGPNRFFYLDPRELGFTVGDIRRRAHECHVRESASGQLYLFCGTIAVPLPISVGELPQPMRQRLGFTGLGQTRSPGCHAHSLGPNGQLYICCNDICVPLPIVFGPLP